MKTRPTIFLLASILLLTCLAACTNLPIQDPIVEPIAPLEIHPDTPTPTRSPLYCPSDASFGQVWEVWPKGFKIVDTTPTFNWTYSIRGLRLSSPDEWENYCVPDSYTLHLTTGPEYDDEIVIPVENPSIVLENTHIAMEWTLNQQLDPLKDYRWMMVGNYGDIVIDSWNLNHLHIDSWWPPLSTYFESVFRTGPECVSGDIPTPQLSYPSEGEVIGTLNPTITWAVDICMPPIFWVEISTMPTFEDPVNTTVRILPEEYTAVRQANTPWMYVEYILRDCEEYYWRVTSGFGTGSSREWGTPSGVQTFSVNLGACPTPTPTLTNTHPPMLMPGISTPTKKPLPAATATTATVNCTGLDRGACDDISACEWYEGYCRVKP